MQTLLSGGAGRRWRQTDATMDVESLGGNSVSSSVERQAMREQLDAVRQTLNSLASAPQANANGVNTAAAGIDTALADIATKLASIEGLYASLTSKLEKVDHRVEDSERHIKDLQHFSASTIHETARLVDYVGGRTPPRNSSLAGAGPSGVATGVQQRVRHSGVPSTPPPPGLSPLRSTAGNLDLVPAYVTATIQQHAAQIHKVIAGLDFLEGHIIRQDQLLENVHKQIVSVARDVAASSAIADSRSRPSELSVRVHDMGELLDKLRAHMYKVEKKTSSNDQALASLTQRLQAVEHTAGPAGRPQGSGESAGEQRTTAGPVLLELMTAQEELRGLVQDLYRDVLELRDQLQTQAANLPGASAAEVAEMRSQLSLLMSQVPNLVTENNELKDFAARATKQIDDLSAAVDQQKRQLQQQQEQLLQAVSSANTATGVAGDTAEKLRATVATLQEEMANLDCRLAAVPTHADLEALSSSLQAVESRALSVEAVAEMGLTLTVVRADMDALKERVTVQESAAASQAEQTPPPLLLPVVDEATTGLAGIVSQYPGAAQLAAQVAAAAKADLEEQFGQLRHEVELASASAQASEEAAHSSAESAAATAAAAEQADKAAAAALQEMFVAMVASLEQEQCALKQQLAQLAEQVSQEQAAISSGLLQVQEQVVAVASTATEAVACAKAMEERESPEEQLNGIRAELQETVAAVMQRLKERVEEGMQQMDAQLSVFSDRLHGAVTPEQLEAALDGLRAATTHASERCDLVSASMEPMREEVILLTGKQDVMESRVQVLESVLGVDIRDSALAGAAPSQSPLEAENAEPGTGDEAEAPPTAASALLPVAAAPAGGRGLLDLVAELQSRVGELESALEAGAADMSQLRDLMRSNVETTQDSIQQATSQLLSDLQGLSAAVDRRAASVAADFLAMEAAAAAVQQQMADQAGMTSELASRVTEVQVRLENEVVARVLETSAAVSALSARLARDYVSREQLGAIFKARDNMKRAVDELATVFSTGRLLRTASSDEDGATDAERPAGTGPTRCDSGTLSTRLASALEDLAGKQAELEHQVHLALHRSDSAVRQEQLTSVQQAMLSLEMQFRRLGAGASAAVAPVSADAEAQVEASVGGGIIGSCSELSELRTRVEALEAALAGSGGAAASTDAEGVGPGIKEDSLPSESTIHVPLTPEDPAESSSPVRLRLLDADAAAATAAAAATPRLLVPEAEPEVHVGEPSLSSMLLGVATATGGEDGVGGPTVVESSSADCSPDAPSRSVQSAATAALEAQEELRSLRAALQDLALKSEALRSDVAAEGAERQRLSEALAELQERLDLQVTATASTAAMVATMATDQPHGRVQLKLRVGPPEVEMDVAALAAKVRTLATRVEAAEEALASAFVVRTPRSPRRAAALEQQQPLLSSSNAGGGTTDAAVQPAVDQDEEGQEEEVFSGSEEGLRTALGTMVPVTPREVEQQLAALVTKQQKLEAALAALAGRVDGLEAVDALEEVRAVASEAVLDAIPGMVSQQVAVLRDEMEAMVGRQGEQLLEMAGQAARDAAEAVRAVREAVAEAAAAREAVESGLAENGGNAMDPEAAVAAAREAALEVCMAVARQAAAEEVKGVCGAVEVLSERMNDVDALRDQLEELAAQVRDSMTASATAAAGSEARTAAAAAPAAQAPPCSPNGTAAAAVASIFTPASTALVIPPARTPRGAPASPTAGAGRQTPTGSASSGQQAAFLARLVDVVKRQSSRLHAQYSDAEETGAALAQVDHTLEEAEARLADVRDANSPAFAETLVTVLEQVAALRYIGSQTHPAVQQMVLEHENRLDQIADDIKALGGGSPPRAAAPAPPPALLDEVGSLSRHAARMEAELARVTGQQAALDRAVKDMLTAVGSVRLGSASVSGVSLSGTSFSARDRSRRSTAAEGEVLEESAEPEEEPLVSEGGALLPEADSVSAGPASHPIASVSASLELAGLAAQVRLLEGTLEAQLAGLRQEVMAQLRSRAGSAGSGGAGGSGGDGSWGGGGGAGAGGVVTAAELGEVERTVAKLHSAVTAIRNRLLAMQEYVDSTQGMIKDMHVGLGGLHRRVDALEASAGPGGRSARVSGCGSVCSDTGSVRELQADLTKFERRILQLEASSLEAAHSLASLKGLAPRVTEAETRLMDACSKLAAALGGNTSTAAPIIPSVVPGATLPAVAGAVRALERRLGGRVEAACGALDSLAGALSAAGRIQAESTANPFKAISAAVNNPVLVAMEKKLETVRAELLAAATSMSEDMRRDLQQAQLESRLAAADASVSGGSVHGSGGGGGVTFRL